jgi:predicted membrane chloride channel (bestrophin family)
MCLFCVRQCPSIIHQVATLNVATLTIFTFVFLSYTALDLDGLGSASNNIEIFEKGYGKDAADIAKDAISYGNNSGSSKLRHRQINK